MNHRTIGFSTHGPPRSQAKNCTDSVVQSVHQRNRELTHPVIQPGAIHQFQTQRYGNGVLRQARHRGLEQEVSSKASPIEIRGQRHYMGLPDIDTEHVGGRDNDTRPTFVETDPVDPTSGHHGADRSIRVPAATASPREGRRFPARAASANNWSANDIPDTAA